MTIHRNQTKFKTAKYPFRNLLVRRLFVFLLSFLIIFNFSLGNAWAIEGQNVKGQNIPSLFWQGIKEGFAGAKEGLGCTWKYLADAIYHPEGDPPGSGETSPPLAGPPKLDEASNPQSPTNNTTTNSQANSNQSTTNHNWDNEGTDNEGIDNERTDNEELYNKNVASEGKNKQLGDDEKKTIEDSTTPLTTIVTTTAAVTTTITTPANISNNTTTTTTTPTAATTTNNNY